MYNDQDKEAELFGIWQTDKWRYTLTEDGHIPKNEYGNIELFNGPLPDGTIWCNIPKVTFYARKLGVEAVASVTRFDTARGRMVPVVEGAVIFERDLPAIEREAALAKVKAETALRRRVVKQAKNVWRQLFVAIATKKYLADKYS